MSDNKLGGRYPLMGGAAPKRMLQGISGTRSAWLVGLVLGLWLGLDVGMVLAQSSSENQTENSSNCPVMGALARPTRHTAAGPTGAIR